MTLAVTIIGGTIAATSTVLVGMMTFRLGMVNSDRERIKALEERLDRLDEALAEERAYAAALADHIYRGKPPPPPPHPKRRNVPLVPWAALLQIEIATKIATNIVFLKPRTSPPPG